MLSCPACGEDIAPLFIPVADAPHFLGIAPEEVQRLIDHKEVDLRVDISNFPSLEDISDQPCNPRRGSKATRLIQKMFTMNRLYARQR